MAVPVVAAFTFNVTSGGGTATSVTLTKPSGVVSGDLLMLLVGNEDNTATASFAAKTGWTKEYEFGNATPDTKIGMYWRIADGTEPATEVVSWAATGGDYGGGWYLRITGAHGSAPIHLLGTSAQTAGATSQAAPSITTTVADTLCFAHHSFDGADGTHGVSGTNWPSSFPTDQFIFDTQPTTTAWCGGWVTQDKASAGATNACTFSSSVSDGMVEVQFAVAPGAGGGTTFPQTIAATAVGVATLGRANTFFRTLAATAIGAATVGRVNTFFRALAATAVGSAVIGKVTTFFRALAATAVGSATLASASVVGQALAATAVGAATITSALVIGVTASATAVGTATLSAAVTFGQMVVATAIGAASLVATFIAGVGGAVACNVNSLICSVGRLMRR